MNENKYSTEALKKVQESSYAEILDDVKIIYGLCEENVQSYEKDGIIYLPLNKENIVKVAKNFIYLKYCIEHKIIDKSPRRYTIRVKSKEELKMKKEEFLNKKNFTKYRKELVKKDRYERVIFPSFLYEKISIEDMQRALEDHQSFSCLRYPVTDKIHLYRYGNNITNYNPEVDSIGYKKEKSCGGNEKTIFENTYFGLRIFLIGYRYAFTLIPKYIEAMEISAKVLGRIDYSELRKNYKDIEDYWMEILFTSPRTIKELKKFIDMEDGVIGKSILAQSFDTDFYPWDTMEEFISKYEYYKKILIFKNCNTNEMERECGLDYQNKNILNIIDIYDDAVRRFINNKENPDENVNKYISDINLLDIEVAAMFMNATLAYPEYERRVEQESKKGRKYKPIGDKVWLSSIYFKEANDINDVRIIFKNLAKKYHPDVIGNESIFMEIKKEYDEIMEMN